MISIYILNIYLATVPGTLMYCFKQSHFITYSPSSWKLSKPFSKYHIYCSPSTFLHSVFVTFPRRKKSLTPFSRVLNIMKSSYLILFLQSQSRNTGYTTRGQRLRLCLCVSPGLSIVLKPYRRIEMNTLLDNVV